MEETKGEFLTEDVRELMERLRSRIKEGSPAHIRRSSTFVESAMEGNQTKTHQKLKHGYNLSMDAFIGREGDIGSPEKRTISSQTFANTTLRRMQSQSLRHKQYIEDEKAKIEAKLQAEIQPFHLSDASRKLVSKTQPIFLRVQKEIEDRMQKTKEFAEKLAMEKEESLEKELTFSPAIVQKDCRHRMTPQEFFIYNQNWKQESQKVNKAKKDEEHMKEIGAVLERPEIDPVSRKMTNKPQYRKPVQTRLAEFSERREKKLTALRESLQPSFRPTINPHSQKLLRKSSTPPAFARLYTPKRVQNPPFPDVETEPGKWSPNAPTVFFDL